MQMGANLQLETEKKKKKKFKRVLAISNLILVEILIELHACGRQKNHKMKPNLTKSLVSSLSLLIVIITPTLIATTDEICELAFGSDCTNTTFSSLDGNVYSFGYKSVLSSDITFTSSNINTTLSCQGGFSCFFSTNNLNDVEFDRGGTVDCLGDHSCSNMDIDTMIFDIVNTPGLITCEGSNSCSKYRTKSGADPNIRGKNLICAGDQSCVSLYVEDTRVLNVFGAFAMIETTWQGPMVPDITIIMNLYGYYSGWLFYNHVTSAHISFFSFFSFFFFFFPNFVFFKKTTLKDAFTIHDS